MPTNEIAEPRLVRLVLVRHGERERDGAELAPLTAGGRWQAEQLGAWLDGITTLKPEAILCSRSRHAHEHAKIASSLLARGVPVVPVVGLTPHTAESEFNLAAIRREAATTIDWRRLLNVTCVGHETRLQQLAHALTGETPDVLLPGELLCVEGDSWEALEAGRGRLGLRIQPAGVTGDETELIPKIRSKMQTSALLAGFTSTVFGIVLTQSDYWTPWESQAANWNSAAQAWQAGAVAAGLVCLALATLLFVVSIYMYDRLAMPRRYWDATDSEKPLRQDLWRSFRRDRVRHGLLYAYMVWVWRFVFSTAVGMALLGFTALVLHRGAWPVAVIYVTAIGISMLYYVLFRPELGVD